MENPLQVVLDWFNSQPAEITTDLSGLVILHANPAASLIPDENPSPEEQFREWFAPTGNRRADISKALMLRSVMDYLIVGRFEKAWWEKQKATMAEFKAFTAADDDDGHLARHSDETIQRNPLRAAMWIRAGQGWNENCAPALSNEGLNAYSEDYWLNMRMPT